MDMVSLKKNNPISTESQKKSSKKTQKKFAVLKKAVFLRPQIWMIVFRSENGIQKWQRVLWHVGKIYTRIDRIIRGLSGWIKN